MWGGNQYWALYIFLQLFSTACLILTLPGCGKRRLISTFLLGKISNNPNKLLIKTDYNAQKSDLHMISLSFASFWFVFVLVPQIKHTRSPPLLLEKHHQWVCWCKTGGDGCRAYLSIHLKFHSIWKTCLRLEKSVFRNTPYKNTDSN